MNLLQKKKNDFPKSDFPKLDFPKLDSPKSDSPKSEPPKLDVSPSVPSKTPNVSNNVPSEVVEKKSPSVLTEDVRIADLFVPLTTIKPGNKYFEVVFNRIVKPELTTTSTTYHLQCQMNIGSGGT